MRKKPAKHKNSWFTAFTKGVAHAAGLPSTSLVALLVILVWAISGPFFHFSDTWQLVINTGTTIITFLMVFLIQNTQNRDSCAMQLKLDELIRAIENAHDSLMDIEELGEQELAKIKAQYEKLAAGARENLRTEDGGFDVFAKKAESGRRARPKEPRP